MALSPRLQKYYRIVSQSIDVFKSGTHNLLNNEIIPQDAAQDSQNWITQDTGVIELAGGRSIVGSEGTAGVTSNQWFGYKIDGTKVHFRKAGTKVQVLIGSAWTDVITGLTASAKYTFANYASQSGTFVFIGGVDGMYKIVVANPTNYIKLLDSSSPYSGYLMIDKGRMKVWNTPTDKTGMYDSYIDAQLVGTQYTQVAGESIGTGDGTTKTFAHNLGAISSHRNVFGLSLFSGIAAAVNISGINLNSTAQITATAHGLILEDKVYISSVSGMTQINGKIANVIGIVDANNFVVDVNSLAYTAYSSGGTVQKIELFIDDFLGNLKSNLNGTGTINYVTGVSSVTFNTAPINSAPITVSYNWEDTTNKSLADFTYGSPRQAGQGNIFRQDEGGDAIQQILVGPDGKYYSMKKQSVYIFDEGDNTDIAQTNNVFRKDIGVPSPFASVSTGVGIIFMNTANPSKPQLTILTPNTLGDNLIPKILFPQFDFAKYIYDQDTVVDFYDRFVVVSCKSVANHTNDVLLIGNVSKNTIEATTYGVQCFSKDGDNLYGGSPLELTTYQLFNGYDDLDLPITNFWKSKGELYGDESYLHKIRRIRLAGLIDHSQWYEVYISYDDTSYQLVGTVRGDGDYVDYSNPQTVGTNLVGVADIGGDSSTTVYPYFTEIKVGKCPKFRKRSIMLVAKGIGYVSARRMEDWDILHFENRLPSRFRQKQNVSLDGTQTDMDFPDH